MTVNGRRDIRDRISTVLLSILLLAFITSCGGGGETGSIGAVASSPTLVSIEVTPAEPVIALGMETQLTATGIYSDNTKRDLTETVAWHSSDDRVVTVSRGCAKSLGPGTAVVWARSENISASRVLTVTNASLIAIKITPAHPEAALGTTEQFTATGIFSDGSMQDVTQQVSWSSADDAIASVSNVAGTKGLTTSFAVGKTTISAELGGVSADTDFTVTDAVLVSIEVTPANTSTPKGMTLQFTATGIYSDHTTHELTQQVGWSSSDPAVASVSNAAGANGLATALTVGSATISATLGTVTGTTTLDVTPATLLSIDISPANPSLVQGTIRQLTATGCYSDSSTLDITNRVTWNVSDPAVASVSNAAGANGLATALTVGSATISATLGTATGTTTLTVTAAVLESIEVDPYDAATVVGVTRQFVASGVYSDGTVQDLTQQVTWSSSDRTVATISNAAGSKGIATPARVGSTVVSATLGGVKGSATLTVSHATLVSITLTPANPSLQVGETLQFTATGYYSNGMELDITKAALWKSSSTKVAKISNAKAGRGLATGVRKGKAAITATWSDVSGTTTLNVE